jgi:protein-S-isoprenylcysteine O-methyltransferase Ste14
LTTLQIVASVEIPVCWALGLCPFLSRAKQQSSRPSVIAPKARWGIALQILAFLLVSILLLKPKPEGVLVAAIVILPLSVLLGWRAVVHLGKQWRIQAGLYSDHELVRTGPYKVVRHPIYVALLGMLIGTGLVVSWWPIVILAGVLFISGMEIRIRAEDALLADRFGEAFDNYRAAVAAYIPFLR